MNIDWKLLRRQKAALLKITMSKNCHYVYSGNRRIGKVVIISSQQSGLLDGLVNLIDSIQDNAVDNDGLSEEKVFGFKGKPCK